MRLNIIKFFVTVLMLFTAFGYAQAFASDAIKLKSKEVDFVNHNENRPIRVKFWYQADVESCEAKICLLPKQSSHRIAIISHGAFGSPMHWLRRAGLLLE